MSFGGGYLGKSSVHWTLFVWAHSTYWEFSHVENLMNGRGGGGISSSPSGYAAGMNFCKILRRGRGRFLKCWPRAVVATENISSCSSGIFDMRLGIRGHTERGKIDQSKRLLPLR